MKRMVAIAAVLTCVLLAGCGKTEEAQNATETVTEEETVAEYIPTEVDTSSEFMAYITEFDGYAAVVDEVEWVNVPSERAEELKIEEEDAPNGYYVYNPDVTAERFELSEDCAIAIIIQIHSGVYDLRNITAEDFAEVLRERGEQNYIVPYAIEVKNGAIVSITE